MHTSVCWHAALLEDVRVTVTAPVDEACLAAAFSSTSWLICNGKRSFIAQTLLSHFTALLTEQISQNGPETKIINSAE